MSVEKSWDDLPPEMLMKILQSLPVPVLITCSAVCTKWKNPSRNAIRQSGDACSAFIRRPQDVQGLNNIISSVEFAHMRDIINGLHIKVRREYSSIAAASSSSSFQQYANTNSMDSHSTQTAEIKSKLVDKKRIVKEILTAHWTYLILDMGKHWDQVLSMNDVLVFRELIYATSLRVRKLVVNQDEDCEFLCACETEFSQLNVLQLEKEQALHGSHLEEFVTTLVPNLTAITGATINVQVHSTLNPFILQLMKSIRVTPDNVVPAHGLMDGFNAVSGLQRLDLQLYHCHSHDNDDIIFSMVLKSLQTLVELRMYTLEFYKLFKTHPNLKFPTLRLLSLATDVIMPVKDEIDVLKELQLPKICPNLRRVELSLDVHMQFTDYEEEDVIPVEVPITVDQRDLPMEIKFEYCQDRFSPEYFQYLTSIYPSFTKVTVLEWEQGNNPYQLSSIFTDCRLLEYLEINVSGQAPSHSLGFALDALLCGIDIVQARSFFRKPGRWNSKMKPFFVPTRPSLLDARNLKEFKIVTSKTTGVGPFVTYSWAIQVTDNIPVRRVRKLKVTFEGRKDLYNRISCLRALSTLLCARVY